MNIFKKALGSLLTIISPSLNIRFMYFLSYKRKLSLSHPTSLAEKIQYLRIKYYNNSDLVARCANKIDVREYVKCCGYGFMLNDIIGIYNDVDEVPWNDLPDQFAMKWNFGATYNIICDNKSKLNVEAAKKIMKKWGKNKYWLPYAEMQYKNCSKKILIEKYLQTNKGFLPYDYKLYVFNGVVIAVLVIGDRDGEKKGAFYDRKWNYIGTPQKHYKSFSDEVERPDDFNLMIDCAETLAKPFPFVRVDFFDYNGKAIFGEMTFTPAAGLYMATIPINGKEMGEYLKLQL